MQRDPPTVAAVIPTHNGARYLAATLDAVLAQQVPPREIIVVDDGSTDDSAAVVGRFAAAVRYVRTTENRGICHARNTGIAASSSDWIALCDHDDLWRPDKLARQLRLIELAPQVEFQFTDFVDVVDDLWTDRRKFSQVDAAWWREGRRELGDDMWVFETSLFGRLVGFQPIFPSTAVFSRALFERVGGFNDALGREQTEDLEFTLRAVEETKFGAIALPLVGKRDHAANYSGDNLATAMSHIRVLRHVVRHNPAAAGHLAVINDQIARRSRDAANAAFAGGDLALARELLRGVPGAMRDPKLRLKAAVTSLPPWIAQKLCRLLVQP